MALPECPICGSDTVCRVSEWTYQCITCRHWTSNLQGSSDWNSGRPLADTETPLGFLDPVRRINFNRILSKAANAAPDGPWLDVGCGDGLFMTMAAEQGFSITGVEEQADLAAAARTRGHTALEGLFPGALPAENRYAAIFFNDVMEHIPDVNLALESCRERLLKGGVVVLNVPNAGGMFFRIASLLYRLGIHGPYRRLWQTNFYSPHLHYFTRTSVGILATKYGFQQLGEIEELHSVTLEGLWNRVAAEPNTTAIQRLLTYAGTATLVPLSLLFTSDSMVAYLRASD